MARNPLNEAFLRTSFLSATNAAYVEDMQAEYERNPGSVSDEWRHFFESLNEERGGSRNGDRGPSWGISPPELLENGDLVAALTGDYQSTERTIRTNLQAKSHQLGYEMSPAASLRATQDSIRALMLIRAYRVMGHLAADLDPLGLADRKVHRELKPETYGFTDADLDRPIFIDRVFGLETATMRHILRILRRTYCRHIGAQFMHITSPTQKAWIQDRIEGEEKEIRFTPEGRRAILNKLIETETFEKFCEVKYTGTKRFGIDGAESMVPALEQIIKRGGQLGVKEIIVGMAHRGRLNVLANVMAKPHRAIFHEFKGGSFKPDDVEGSGDVKYHLGASSDRSFDGNNVHLSLTANPSHLEIVDPVVLGKVRAKQDQRGCAAGERTPVLPLIIHGDAAFAGQGVVAECFGLSGLKGHRTGGSIHFIINNQIGFTTNPRHSRSSPYCSDVARMIEAPIFHVNGDDPEAVVHVAKIATEFRQKFQKPVVIDMFCYRRYGHNEADEPMFTQPLMYKAIKSHPTVIDIYSEAPRRGGRGAAGGEPAHADELPGAPRGRVCDRRQFPSQQGRLARRSLGRHGLCRRRCAPRRDGCQHRAAADHRPPHHVDPARLQRAQGRAPLARAPQGDGRRGQWHRLGDGRASFHRLAARRGLPGAPLGSGFGTRHLLAAPRRAHRSRDRAPLDAAQACRQRPGEVRGHQLDAVGGSGARLRVRLLARRAERARHVGGAVRRLRQRRAGRVRPVHFIGRAQVAAHVGPRVPAAARLRGQGPEHSSARLERYLQLCAEDNWQVANVTTPANYFHILRRQLHRKFRKPLILMTPKSLLRHKRVVSRLDEMGPGTTFHRLLWDDAEHKPDEKIKLVSDEKIKRVVICSGKVYYDLYDAREAAGIDNVYLLRAEQLYPFPARALMHELARFTQAEVIWCQEEPKNMGAWSFIEPNLAWVLERIDAKHKRPYYAGRPASASTATGQLSKHLYEQKTLVEAALAGGASS